MKKIIIILSFFSLFVTEVFAAPILNESVANSDIVTVYPDSNDPNLFYVAPNSMGMSNDKDGRPMFLFQEYSVPFVTQALIQVLLVPRYRDLDIEKVKKSLLARNPNARVSVLPWVKSRIKLDSRYEKFINENFCDHKAGQAFDTQSCVFHLTGKGRKIFKETLKRCLSITLQFEYEVHGFIRDATKNLKVYSDIKEFAVEIDGKDLAKYPELFRDKNGKQL